MVAMLALTGCERRISPANIEAANRLHEVAATRPQRTPQVSEGLTPKEVESFLGPPARVETERRPILVQKNLEMTRWFYEQDGKMIELLFVDGNLQQRIPQFGEAPGPAPAVVSPGMVDRTGARPSADGPAR